VLTRDAFLPSGLALGTPDGDNGSLITDGATASDCNEFSPSTGFEPMEMSALAPRLDLQE
jgi:hypothetical protein